MVNIELSSFINPDLRWKNIKKGRRSNRRCRKLVSGSSSFGVELGGKGCKREPHSSNIGTKRLGITVPGGRFTENLADVPIKKRRFLIQSPSPSPSPRMPSPDLEESLSCQPNTSKHLEESELVLGSECAAEGQQSQDLHRPVGIKSMDSVDKVWNNRMFEVTYGKHECDDDFLGIKLLAAAACSSIDDNMVGVNKINSSTTENGAIDIKNSSVQDFAEAKANGSCDAVILKEGIPSSGTVNSSQKCLVNEDDRGNSLVECSTFSVLANHNKNENVGKSKDIVASKYERLRWDLNTVMEDWEEPDDDPLATSCISNTQFVLKDHMQPEKFALKSGGMLTNVNSAHCGNECEMQPVCGKESDCNKACLDSNVVVIATPKSIIQENEEYSSSKGGNNTDNQNVTTHYATESENASPSDCCTKSQQTVISGASDVKVNTFASAIIMEDACCSGARNRKLMPGSFHDENFNLSSADMQCLIKPVFEFNSVQNKSCEDSAEECGLIDSTIKKEISILTDETLEVKASIVESDHSYDFNPSRNGEASSSSSTSVISGGEVKRPDDKACTTNDKISVLSPQNGTVGVTSKTCEHLVSEGSQQDGVIISLGSYRGRVRTVYSGDHGPINQFSDCCGSDITQDGCMIDVDHLTGDAGYDSSFEDGEFREQGAYTWEEHGVKKGETECMDYGGSNYGNRDGFNAADYSTSKKLDGDAGSYYTFHKGNSLQEDNLQKNGIVGSRTAIDGGSNKAAEQFTSGDTFNQNSMVSLNTKFSVEDHFEGHSKYGTTEGNDDAHGPASHVVGRTNNLPLQRGRYGRNYSYSSTGRDFSFKKPMGRDAFSVRACGKYVPEAHGPDSSADYPNVRNWHEKNYRGPEVFDYFRPNNTVDLADTKVGKLSNPNDRCWYRPFARRSTVDWDNSYCGQRGIPSTRGNTQDRIRNKSRLYAQEIRRRPKEYPENGPTTAVRGQQYFDRRERERELSSDFSSNSQFRRPRRNTRSRSRTRSPVAWHSQRDRYMGTRRSSPDLRYNVRTEGRNLPFNKPGFADDSEETFSSAPRGRMWASNKSRWFDDGKYMDSHSRERSSPARMFRNSEGFNSVSYSGRLKSDKSDGFFRSKVQPERFSHVPDSGRRLDLEESDDNRSLQDDKNGMSGHFGAGGIVRRFHYDDEDCFATRNCQNETGLSIKSSIKEDIPRNVTRE